MNQVLSQNEVDALLSVVMEEEPEEVQAEENVSDGATGGSGSNGESDNRQASGQSSGSAGGRDESVESYDLMNQDRIMRGKMPMLEVIHDKFCRDFRTSLSLDLRKMVDIEASTIELVKFREFLHKLPTPSCMSLFNMEPLTGSGLVTFDPEFIFLMVDIFCGGMGSLQFKVEGREFTSIEQGIVKKVVERSLMEWAKAWKPLHEVNVQFSRTEINPQFVNLAHPTEIIVIFKSNVDVEGTRGWMQVILPYAMIEPLRTKLSKGVVGDRVELEKLWRQNMQQKIIESMVEMTGVLGKVKMDIGNLLDMQVGDIVELNTALDEPVIMEVEGEEKFLARSGVCRGNKAIQIMDAIE